MGKLSARKKVIESGAPPTGRNIKRMEHTEKLRKYDKKAGVKLETAGGKRMRIMPKPAKKKR